jgi:glycosyltransferase involved in cell wall biosynthesis
VSSPDFGAPARTQPRVSVLILTYNQERFISQAIESALVQKTDFEYEIVIGEDCSTDSTRQIVRDYANCYPNKVRPLLHERNLGASENFDRTLAECRGEFVAMLEGDDYWISTAKLQTQVDFMDRYADCAMCFHSVHVKGEGGATSPLPEIFPPLTHPQWSTGEDLLSQNFIDTAAVLFRRKLMPQRPRWVSEVEPGDWVMWILLGQYGKIGYLPQILAVYRVHFGGMWSTKSEKWSKSSVTMFEALAEHLLPKYRRLIQRRLAPYRFHLISLHAQRGELNSAKATLRKMIRKGGWQGIAPRRALLKLLVDLYAPFFWNISRMFTRLFRSVRGRLGRARI